MAFGNLRETLLVGGIAPRHVRRYLAELNEHLDDLTREQREAGYEGEDADICARARLGSDDQLASAMLAQKTFRSWAARAPWAVFGLLSPIAAMAAFFALMAILTLVAHAAGLFAHPIINAPHWFRQMVQTAFLLGNFTLAPFLSLAFTVSATRQRLWPGWPLLAVLLIAMLDLHLQAEFPALGMGGGSLGLSAVTWISHFDSLVQRWPMALSQLMLTLLPVLLLYRKYRATI